MLADKNITLLVSGSIAAYKSAELIRELIALGARVRVAMTQGATKFITPLTLQTLSTNNVSLDLFDENSEAEIGHIALADEADLVLVAPASANIIAKTTHGIADDLVSAILLATKAPIVVAPAMNVNMWENAATKTNVEQLRARGIVVMQPGVGALACGWQGAGRFPEVSDILEETICVLTPNDLKDCRVLVTAGPTVEKIDPIRFINNRSSGKMGFALAQQARRRGADVTLVTGPTGLLAPQGMKVVSVESAQEMHEAVFGAVCMPCDSHKKQFVFMAAAVSDHRPVEVAGKKLKNDKSKGYSIKLEPCPDILKSLAEKRAELHSKCGCATTLVGFAAETAVDDEELIALAQEKLERKDIDLVAGNLADSMGSDTNRVWLIERAGRREEVATNDKYHVAAKIIDAAIRVSP